MITWQPWETNPRYNRTVHWYTAMHHRNQRTWPGDWRGSWSYQHLVSAADWLPWQQHDSSCRHSNRYQATPTRLTLPHQTPLYLHADTEHCVAVHGNLVTDSIVQRVWESTCHLNFLNNPRKQWPISIVFGKQHHEETWHKWVQFCPTHLDTVATLPCEMQKS